MQVGNLVVVNSESLRPLKGSLGIVTEIEERGGTYDGTVLYCHAMMCGESGSMVEPGQILKFRIDHLDVVS